MLGKERKKLIKQKASELADVNINDARQFTKEYTAMYDRSEFNCGECFMIMRLVDLYTAIKEGLVNKDEGKVRQKQIFDVIELEE